MRTRAIAAVLTCSLTLVCLAVPAGATKRPAPHLVGTSTCVDTTGNDATYDANSNFADLAKVTLTGMGKKLRIKWTTTAPVISDPRGWWVSLSGAYQIGLTVKDGTVSEAVIDVVDASAKQRTTVDPHSFNGATTTLVVPLKVMPTLADLRPEWRAVVTAGYRSDGDMCSGPDGAFLPLPN